MKDSVSSVPSGELSAQPYIARVGTEDSGCVAAHPARSSAAPTTLSMPDPPVLGVAWAPAGLPQGMAFS